MSIASLVTVVAGLAATVIAGLGGAALGAHISNANAEKRHQDSLPKIRVVFPGPARIGPHLVVYNSGGGGTSIIDVAAESISGSRCLLSTVVDLIPIHVGSRDAVTIKFPVSELSQASFNTEQRFVLARFIVTDVEERTYSAEIGETNREQLIGWLEPPAKFGLPPGHTA